MPTRIASISGLRGVVGDGFAPPGASEFAAAYAADCGDGPIVVGHDGRPTAAVFLAAVVAGINATGRDALVAGPAATPTIGVLVTERKAAGAVQISASHNPPEYNGLKCFDPAGMVVSGERGRAILDRIERKDYGWASWDRLGTARPLEDPDREHLERVLAIVDVEAIRRARFRVGLDACHGSGGRLGSALLRALGCESTVLGGTPDGRYEHPPEPTEANLRTFSRVVPALGASVGFAQDPDADRLAIVDEKGRYIGEELTLALAARRVLASRPGPLVLNLSTSRTAETIARELGCEVARTQVGEAHVVAGMRERSARLGGEGNGGVIDPRVGWVRDSFAGIALVLDLLAAERQPLSAVVADLPKFGMVKEKFPIAGKDLRAILAEIEADYPEARLDHRDGLRIDGPDGWIHVRASNTEPILRVIAESADVDAARALAERVGRIVTGGSV